MKKEFKILILICFIIFEILLIGFIGYKIGVEKNKNVSLNEKYVLKTFYATITDISGKNIVVKGLDINNIDFRNKFLLPYNDNTNIEWQNKKINVNDLNIEDTIAITFDGTISKTNPVTIKNIIKIELLNDRNNLNVSCLETYIGSSITSNTVEPKEINLGDIIDYDISKVNYSKVKITDNGWIYAIVKTQDDVVVNELNNYFNNNYKGYKSATTLDNTHIYIYNGSTIFDLNNIIKICIK